MPGKRNGSFASAVEISGMIVGLMIMVEGVDLTFHAGLDRFGIAPRTVSGLIGIVLSPLLHANLPHLLANAGPLFLLLVLLFWNPRYFPEKTLFLIWFWSGLGTWLIGRPHSIHIGASSLIYGLVAYLILSAFRMKSWRAAFVGLIIFVLYGGLFYGLFPVMPGVSWEGHLSGALAGAWVGWTSHSRAAS